MTTIKLTFAAVVLLVVAWTMATIQPMIPDMARGAADMLAFITRACLGTVLLVAVSSVVWVFLRQRYERDRQRDGAFPLREYHLEPLPKRAIKALFGKPSPKVILDVNAMMTHGAMIFQGIHLAEAPAGWDRQLAYMSDIERTRRVQAAIAGDAVLGNPFVNLQRGIGGVANAATGRMLAGAYDKPIKPQSFVDVPSEQEPARLPAPELTGTEAVEQSRPASIVMGQTDDGALVRWNMTQTPHLRFHGMTQGSGKTNAIQTVAAGALATGAHVVVCDRVQFKDWGDFDGRAEFVDTSNPQQLADACARLYNIYLGRTHKLRQAGAKNIAQHGRMQRIVVVISEFGAQMASARADGVGREVEYPLTQLARLAGSTGIHLIAEDQVTKGWPRELAGNMVPVIGRMPAYAGQACGYQGRGGGTDTFPSYTFWYEGVMLKTPHMEPVLGDVLADVPAPKALVMLTPAAEIPGDVDGERSTVPSVPQGQNGGEGAPFSTVLPLENAGTEWNAGTPTVDEPGRWDDVVAAWFAANPQALTGPAQGISDLARAMCRDNEGNDANYVAYKGRAHKLFHEFRNNVRLPGGDKLGTDITGGAV